MKDLCEKLNKHLPCKTQDDEDAAKAYADYRLKRIEHAHTDMLD